MKVSRYTPSLLTSETLEALFVQRDKLAKRLVEQIRVSALTNSKQFNLLIGPRGIGKTHLISMLYHRVSQQTDLRDHLVIAWLWEEEWGVGSFFDLVLRILNALQAECKDDDLASRISRLYDLSPEEAEQVALSTLKNFIGERTLLLLMENLEVVFAELGDIGQKQLRSFLQEQSCCTIVATSQSLFNGVKLQTSPFYGFFRIQYLKDLSVEEAVTLLKNIAQQEENRKLVNFVQTTKGRSRVQAVHHLAGGNHRIYVVFSEFLANESLDNLIQPFMKMLDDLTPYYQERMMHLTSLQRKIIKVLTRHIYAMSVKEIARRCFATHQTISNQLKILRDRGYVSSDNIGRQSFYELREPLLRICLSIKETRGEPVRLIVDFLKAWYSRKELKELEAQTTNTSESSRFDSYYLKLAQERNAEEEHDPRIAAHYKALFEKYQQKDYDAALYHMHRLVELQGLSEDYLGQGILLDNLGWHKEAIRSFDKALDIKSDDFQSWNNRGYALFNLERYEEAIESWDNTLKIVEDFHLAWTNRGIALRYSGQYEEAISSFDKALALKPKDDSVWNSRGIALRYLGRYEEAIENFDEALKINPDRKFGKLNRAEMVFALNPNDKAYEVLEDALNQLTDVAISNNWWADIMLISLFKRNQDTQQWEFHIRKLVPLFKAYQFLNALGVGLIESCDALISEMVSQNAAQAWLEVWTEVAEGHEEFKIPLRILTTAVHYKAAPNDPRVFLQLPTEERTILKQALGLETK
ncbi:tetratricopeptide repeat protein [Acaryochloris sp. IP29b_bin.137]|uniref:tetratricopeptide repeat protein n=1 Tax=Acaryochloris sp. IP29b_bin.137 TaxID=2969217 RepID=UPI00260A2088|nr:tetratricopeptide repeat protein [Acaryochloris sp. IP29b_bin.137]